MFIITDWAGNIVFEGIEFKTFDDAEEFLCESFRKNDMDYEEWRGEFYIEEKSRYK